MMCASIDLVERAVRWQRYKRRLRLIINTLHSILNVVDFECIVPSRIRRDGSLGLHVNFMFSEERARVNRSGLERSGR